MARQARLFIPQCPLVLELQGMGGQPVFKTRQAFALFQDRMPQSAQEERIAVHAYCLAPTGAMLMVSAQQPDAVGRFVQNINRHFSAFIRQNQGRQVGSVWAPRFKSTVVQPNPHSLTASVFVETWATRTGQAHDLANYAWSSYAAHIGLVSAPWLTDLPLYWQLGNTPFERQSRYKQLSEQGPSPREVAELHDCLQKGWLWSDDAFYRQVAEHANRPARPRPKGRPMA